MATLEELRAENKELQKKLAAKKELLQIAKQRKEIIKQNAKLMREL